MKLNHMRLILENKFGFDQKQNDEFIDELFAEIGEEVTDASFLLQLVIYLHGRIRELEKMSGGNRK